MRSLSISVLGLLATAAICGCDPAPTSGDAGADAGPIDADRMDSGPVDSGPPPVTCVGTPTPCGTLATETECRTVMGCLFSQCAGFAVACDRNPTEPTCTAEMGCTWNGSECMGTARDCGTFPDSAACSEQTGCTWSARAQCRGTAVACAVLPAAVCMAQPGCLVDRPDAGPVDSGPPDANCMSGAAGSTTVEIHTVEPAMAGGTTALGNVAVRAEGPCASAAIEMTTDASGDLSLELPNAGAPWSVTFALAGYSAVSILDITSIGFDGDVRLDPIGVPDYVGYEASGAVAGTVGIGSTVQVDSYDFQTTMAGAGGAWSSMFYLAPAPSPAPPLTFVALELDGTGRAVNFASSIEQPRLGAPVTGVAMILPTPAAEVTESRITYHLPTSGIADASGGVFPFTVMHALLDLAQTPFVAVGSSSVETGATPGDVTLVVRHFGGPLDANLTGFQIQGATGIINVMLTDVSDHEVTVPPIDSLGVAGASLGAVGATGVGDGYDVLALHIGETDVDDPHWRVFADASGGAATIASVPHLPSSVSLADIGLTDAMTYVLPLYVRMASGRAWSAQGLNQASPQYAYAGGASYVLVSVEDL